MTREASHQLAIELQSIFDKNLEDLRALAKEKGLLDISLSIGRTCYIFDETHYTKKPTVNVMHN